EIYADEFRFEAMIKNHMTRTMSLAPEEWGPGDGVLASVAYDEERLELAKQAVARLDLFGLQHRLDEFCDELGSRYGLTIGPPRRPHTTESYEVPQSFRDRIAEDNALDVALYEYACDLYEQRHPA